MSFVLLPAIDVIGDGVRGANDDRDPLAVALTLQSAGAEWIHLVDLDAAYGRGHHRELVASMVAALSIHVEIAGGVVDDESLTAALATGCSRVVIGTAALADAEWCAWAVATYGVRIAVSLDVQPVEGRVESTAHRLVARGSGLDVGLLWPALHALEAAGCQRVIVTDVGRDGSLSGFDPAFYIAVARATSAQVIASGGASSLQDLAAMKSASLVAPNLEGAVVGAALHTGRFTFDEACAIVLS